MVSKQLEHLQRLACLYITGAKRTASTAALKLIIGILPLAVYIKQEAMASCFRLIINAQGVQTTSGHTKIKNILATYIPLSQHRELIKFNQNMFDKNFTVCIPNRQDWKNGIILNNYVVCFTGGSRFEQTGLSGASVCNQTDGEEFILPLGRHTSVFQAEVYALLYCARLENLVNRNNSSIAICCDSLAAINAMSAFKATTGG